MRIVFGVLVAVMMVGAMPAHAQDESAASDRLTRLERDLNFLQRQVYRNSAGGESAGEGQPVANSASMEIRLSQMREEIRGLRGQLEQAQFQAKQTSDELKKLSVDVDYRLQAIEQKQAAAAAAAAAAAVVPPAAPVAKAPGTEHQASGFSPDDAGIAPPVDAAHAAAATSATGKDFPDANAHYNHAFKLLNEKNYSAAASSFDAFVKKYPTDPLAGNSYYWLGESHYARGDYTRAAEGFRKGYEANPEGQKASDNLLKLGLSLAQVKRVSEACIVLSQVATKYAQTNIRSASRAEKKYTELQCK